METEKMMGHVRDIDRNFMMKIEYLDDMQGDASSWSPLRSLIHVWFNVSSLCESVYCEVAV